MQCSFGCGRTSFGEVKLIRRRGAAMVYLANIPRRMNDCPVYTTVPIPELKTEAPPLKSRTPDTFSDSGSIKAMV